MKIAIQEDMLPGGTMTEKFETAKALGLDGVEVWGRDLATKIYAIAEASQQTGVPVSSVNHGRQGRLLDPHPAERARALAELRASITGAVDLKADCVVLVPMFYGPLLPDLGPWLSPFELESELFYTHLRTLSDFCEALDNLLCIEPINRYETSFLNRVEQAAAIAQRLDHPRVKVTADVYHMALEEADLPAALRDHAQWIGHVHLADNNRRLPGQGLLNFAPIAEALAASGYDGWLVLECGAPSANQPHAAAYRRDLPASLAYLKEAGLR
ncbi:MAG: sugar phosphate isomerase/epimerase [Chloroflexi bacterium]|nr:sugar phosphate isomerase/epimerase [Chloroflexota bacterium]